ncbi:ribosome biogenesis protein NOP53 [Anopheles aquasalis]|uniref:ribosome biogenesis protein NOP53 n=1 Tax=Anopheles aquasalis TaxID=42839 RepID=UPI00215A5CB8|nr:ribosome biogenesis protein NOP53 [Anopheles aquasalis]
MKKHVSRKLKSSWRKHIDTSEIDSFLEQQRQDERIAPNADQPDNELFSEERKPGKPKTTLRELRRKQFSETPKSLLPLKNTSQVRDPIVKRNVKQSSSSSSIPAKQGGGTFRPQRKRPLCRKNVCDVTMQEDMWNDESGGVPKSLQSEWIGKEQVLHTLRHSGKPLVKQPGKIVIGKEKAAASNLPHQGISYNPPIDDYLELKNKAVEEERSIRKRQAHFDRVVTNMFAKEEPAERRARQFKELTEGLIEAQDPDSDAEQDEGTEGNSESIKGKRKTIKARKSVNKRRTQFQEARERYQLKMELKKMMEINRLTEITNEVQNAEAKLAVKKLKAAKKQAAAATETLPIDFIEPERLSGNLRTIQPNRDLIATGLPKLRQASVIKKSRAEVQRKKSRSLKKVRYVRRSHKEADD